MSSDAVARKSRSNALLVSLSIGTNAQLPVIETAPEITLREGETVMRRSMCLFAVSYAAIHESRTDALALIDRWKVGGDLTAAERAFLHLGIRSEPERIQFSWRSEALIPLMWATGLLDELPFPTDIFDFEYLSEFWLGVPSGFWEGVGTRTAEEILDEADLIYRLHWGIRDAQLNGRPSPGDLHAGVVAERHHSLNWLISYDAADWDEITTDT